jgi:hypothetical protein
MIHRLLLLALVAALAMTGGTRPITSEARVAVEG